MSALLSSSSFPNQLIPSRQKKEFVSLVSAPGEESSVVISTRVKIFSFFFFRGNEESSHASLKKNEHIRSAGRKIEADKEIAIEVKVRDWFEKKDFYFFIRREREVRGRNFIADSCVSGVGGIVLLSGH